MFNKKKQKKKMQINFSTVFLLSNFRILVKNNFFLNLIDFGCEIDY